MATTLQRIQQILTKADLKFETDEGNELIRLLWMRDDEPLVLLILLLEDGELVQLRAPSLVFATQEANRELLFRTMLQMAHETSMVRFDYDPADGEVSTCIDIALEDADLVDDQLLRCCSGLLDVSYWARERFDTILRTGEDPAWEGSE